MPTQFDLGHFTVDTQVSLKKQEHGKKSDLKGLIFFFFKSEVSASCNSKREVEGGGLMLPILLLRRSQ